MSIIEVSPVSPWEAVAAWEPAVASGIDAATADACAAQPRLRAAVSHIVSVHTDRAERSPRRLFASVVLGAVTGGPEPAVPVCVVSNLWWAGAEALDDLVDAGRHGPVDTPPGLSRAGLLTAAIACMSVVPHAYLATAPVPERLRVTWLAETARASIAAAEGQLADMAREPSALAWPRVMAAYVGKTGAAYERDAVMAAQCATGDTTTIRGCRAFGQLFGVLRQVHNDNDDCAPADDEDLANGTPTLLLAHALDVLPPDDRARLLDLRRAATADAGARAEMRAALHRDEVVAGYRSRLSALRRHAYELLHRLTVPSDFERVLRSWIDCSYVRALTGTEAGP